MHINEITEQKIKESGINDSIKSTWDIPNLICLQTDDLIRISKASGDIEIDSISYNKQSIKKVKEFAFTKTGNHTLYVTTEIRSRRILYFFIDAIESKNYSADGATPDYGDLLKLGQLENSGKNYIVEPIQSLRIKNRFTGIKIIPKCP